MLKNVVHFCQTKRSNIWHQQLRSLVNRVSAMTGISTVWNARSGCLKGKKKCQPACPPLKNKAPICVTWAQIWGGWWRGMTMDLNGIGCDSKFFSLFLVGRVLRARERYFFCFCSASLLVSCRFFTTKKGMLNVRYVKIPVGRRQNNFTKPWFYIDGKKSKYIFTKQTRLNQKTPKQQIVENVSLSLVSPQTGIEFFFFFPVTNKTDLGLLEL